MKKNQQLTVII